MSDTETPAPDATEPGTIEPGTDAATPDGGDAPVAVDAGTFELLHARLKTQAGELAQRAEALNAERLATFGSTELALVGTDRIRTENNCVPRDLVSVGGLMVFGFNVFIGLKPETTVADVFSLHRFAIATDPASDDPAGEATFRFEDATDDDLPGLLGDGQFQRDFAELYRYYSETRLLQLWRPEGKLLAVFQTGKRLEDVRVLRWQVDAGAVSYIDNRGERDHQFPPSHDFTWTPTTREQHVLGRHPHINIENQVFVECVGGDLTIKIEDNTEEGEGVYREPVEARDQSLADADVSYTMIGPLILLRILPYGETVVRHLVFNTRTKSVVRLDGIGQACQRLPEDHGIIFPGGYYLSTGVHKTFDTAATGGVDGLEFKAMRRSPNGEDVLYAFHERAEGRTLLLSYNLIRKQVQNPIACHGYSLFDDGTLVVFRGASNEPTRVHPMQVWRTPFVSDSHAAAQPVGDSPLQRIGNADLVRGISDAMSVRQMVTEMAPSTPVFEALIAATTRMLDAYHWLGEATVGDLRGPLTDVRSTAEQVLDEFEHVVEIRGQSDTALTEADAEVTSLVRRVRGESPRSTDDFVTQLASLRRAQGKLVSLRDLRYIDHARIDAIDATVAEEFDALSGRTVEFLGGDDAFAGHHAKVDELIAAVETASTATEADEIGERVGALAGDLELLTTVVGGLSIADATVRTAILERISEVLGGVNRARALLEGRRKELSSKEGRAEFAAEFSLLSQAVTGSLAMADTPDRCDEQLGQLMLSLENLESRFGDFDDFLETLTAKREDIYEAFSSRKQALLDGRQRRAARMMSSAERLLTTIARRVQTLESVDDINTYFVGDPMVTKLRELTEDLRSLGEPVAAEELAGRLKAAREDANRSLRDRTDLFSDGGETVRLGRHRFAVNTQPFDVTVVPRDDELALAITGTDFRAPVDDDAFAQTREYWNQILPSETPEVYRSEHLAAAILAQAEVRDGDHTVESLHAVAVESDGLLPVVRAEAEKRFDEGYERGVHDHDAALILGALLQLHAVAGLLRHPGTARAAAQLWWTFGLDDTGRSALHRRARSLGRVRSTFGRTPALAALADEITAAVTAFMADTTHDVSDTSRADLALAGEALVEELQAESVSFTTSAAARTLLERCRSAVGTTRSAARRAVEADLRADVPLTERHRLVAAWIDAYLAAHPDDAAEFGPVRDEAIAVELCGTAVSRTDSAAATTASIDGLLGQHPRVTQGRMTIRLDEILARTNGFRTVRLPGFRDFQQQRNEYLERIRHDLRIEEFRPKVMSAFVRNQLIDQVYLPLIGDNLAKQLGATGDDKRTDQSGMLLLISPPGYGKTTLMEYVANRLGLVFVKVNGPALGHQVTSIDPADAPNATARQEIDKVNFALEMGNNVLLYVDDIQHTSPEFLQKFISLTDAQRRMEGVWNGRTRTYDLRGKRFAVCMAGNPYTEGGIRFRVPDMLANRADTYNLGDILSGRDDLFALSYIENSLTSNPTLSALAGRGSDDIDKLVRIASGDTSVRPDQLSHPYGAAELDQILSVLGKILVVQRTLLAVNQTYIASASQADAYRTEPPFQLQGSYRNMNKLAEKIVPAMNDAELDALIDDHYLGEAQTLTTGAEANLLKLAELRGRLSDEQAERWAAIKKAHVRAQALGGDDDPLGKALGQLALLTDAVAAIGDRLEATAAPGIDPTVPAIGQLNATLEAVRFAAQDAAVLGNPRTQYLFGLVRGVIDEVVTPLIGELDRDRADDPDRMRSLLDDTRVRAESLRYLLDQIDGYPELIGPESSPGGPSTGNPTSR